MEEITEEILIPHRRAYTEDVHSMILTEGVYSYQEIWRAPCMESRNSGTAAMEYA